ncbi:MAG: primosomal protein N' [Bacteroidia bacterium]|nr:primosomal protein N' [Bacteroidia bacterium]
MSAGTTWFADLILPLPLPELFTYGVPVEMKDNLVPGMRVVVQFGRQKVFAALVYECHNRPPEKYAVKEILSVLDDFPVVTDSQFRLWKWISDYYLCSMGEVMAAALPSALRLQSESIITRNPEFDGDTSVLTDREYLVFEALEMQQELRLKDISKILSLKHVLPVLRSMLNKRLIRVREEVEEKYKPRMIDVVSLNVNEFPEEKLGKLLDSLEKRAAKQLDLVMAVLQFTREEEVEEIPKSQLLKRSGSTAAALNALVRKGVLKVKKRQEDRIAAYTGSLIEPLVLNPYQEQSLKETKFAFEQGKVTLLHGVTSSGKTELYIHLIRDSLNQGKQVLYLLPEIALTTQLIGRLQKHFGDRLLVYHSRFNEQERVEVWNKLLEDNLNTEGRGRLVIGARSAVLLPLQKLGLVIVDEEHDHSYKQEDPAPRYNARDAAIVMAAQQDAAVLLGTATPSMESYFNALSGKYDLVTLDRRHADLEMPDVALVDMRDARKRKQLSGHFSHALLEELKGVLKEGQQAIIFQNRRGFAPYLECNTCAWTPVCNNCDVSLTYHKFKNELRCHYCGFMQGVPARCVQCGDQDIRMRGYGTERIEEELQSMLPGTRIARLDYDTTRSKSGYRDIITSFEEGEIDVLVGTQMVTKGLDFDRVQLVGILNADSILHYPEFRAHERGFQLLAQVSGRAGRRKHGKVLIQSHQVDNPVLAFVLRHAYKDFYMHELNERYKFFYPPYCRLIEIRLKHKDEKRIDKLSGELTLELKKMFAKRVLGPTIPYVSRVRNLYQRHLLIKLEKTLSISEVKKSLQLALAAFKQKPENRQLIIQVDVDPL